MSKHKTVAVIPVYGRTPLVRLTVRRLLNVNGCEAVVCVGDRKEDEIACSLEGAHWVNHGNKPLGAKWNCGFRTARMFKPDSVLFVGSSDWLTADWLDKMQPHLVGSDIAGKLDTYFLDYRPEKGYRVIHWPGYVRNRAGESIGIGRLMSASILDRLRWKPFQSNLDNSMDYSMMQLAGKLGARFGISRDDIKSLSISCHLWPNKHNFDNEAKHNARVRLDPAHFIEDNGFTEIKELFG